MTSPIHTHAHNTFVKNNNNTTINSLLSANRDDGDGDVDGRRRCWGSVSKLVVTFSKRNAALPASTATATKSEILPRAYRTNTHTAKHQFTTITSSSSSKSNSSSPTVPPPTSSHPLPVCPLHCAYSLSLCRALSSCLSLSLSLSEKLMLCLRALSLIYTCSLLCVCVSVCVYWCCINKSNQRTFLSNPTQNETERRTWLCYCVINFRVYEAG